MTFKAANIWNLSYFGNNPGCFSIYGFTCVKKEGRQFFPFLFIPEGFNRVREGCSDGLVAYRQQGCK